MRIVVNDSGCFSVDGVIARAPAVVGSVVMSESGRLGEVTQVRDGELLSGDVRLAGVGEEFWPMPNVGDAIGGRRGDLVVGLWAHPQAGPGRPWVDVAVLTEKGLVVDTAIAEALWWPQGPSWDGGPTPERVRLCRALGALLSMQREAAQEGSTASWALLEQMWEVLGLSGSREAAAVLARRGLSLPSRPLPVTVRAEVVVEVVREAPSWDCAHPLVTYEDLTAALRGDGVYVQEWDTVDEEADA